MDKEELRKEKFKIALSSTIKVISGKEKLEFSFENKDANLKNLNFFELNNLKNIDDFTKARASADSEALKIKYSNKKIYENNLPRNSTGKLLYNLSKLPNG